jgi:hypothetical protein
MTINILPDFQVYHAVTVKGSNKTGVLEAREAYNIAVGLKVDNIAEIILPKLVKDRIDKNLNVNQKPHFYSLVKEDNSASGNAGFTSDTCIAETAKTNSFKAKTIVVSFEEKLPKTEIIDGNKKVVVCSPAEFITKYRWAMRIRDTVDPKCGLEEFLSAVFFVKPCFIHDSKEEQDSEKKTE